MNIKTHDLLLIIVIFALFYLFHFVDVYSSKTIENISNKSKVVSKESITINPISNSLDAFFLIDKQNEVSEIKKKLVELRDELYLIPYNEILKVVCKYKDKNNFNVNGINTSNKFDVRIEYSDNPLKNTLIIDVPIGKNGVNGPDGDQGDQGDQGDKGDQGETGNCPEKIQY
jgi:hypothetical protein